MNFRKIFSDSTIEKKLQLKELSRMFSYFYLMKSGDKLKVYFSDEPLNKNSFKYSNFNYIDIPKEEIYDYNLIIEKSYDSFLLESIRVHNAKFNVLKNLPVLQVEHSISRSIFHCLTQNGWLQAIKEDTNIKHPEIKIELLFDQIRINVSRIIFNNKVVAYFQNSDELSMSIVNSKEFAKFIEFINLKYSFDICDMTETSEDEIISNIFDIDFCAYVSKSTSIKISNF